MLILRLKTLHTYLLKSFLPPFVLTLFIGVFVFFLINVFTYMDEIVGKGMTAWVLIKFFGYSFFTFIPVAMPLAVLLSSIMTFGSLAENYELAAMKSSGLSLFQIIKPLFFLILVLAGLTFLFNNYALPKLTLKSSQLLWDIRQAKPTLNIKQGIYYNGLNGYSIKVGNKSKDGNTMYDLHMYDHTDGLGNHVQLYADSAVMKTSKDTNYLQLILNHGSRYEEVNQEINHHRTHPLMQLLYRELAINIDMSDFKMKQTDEDLFRNHHEMMPISMISSEIDTFNLILNKKKKTIATQFDNVFVPHTLHVGSLSKQHKNVKQFLDSLNSADYTRVIENAKSQIKNSQSYIESMEKEMFHTEIDRLDFMIGWHQKINVSFACIILFFVGAPLGAIIRKGGMGLPVVVAVVFFLLYYIVSIVYERLVIEGVYNVVFGMWFPLFIFLPVGIFLTYKAARDSSLFDMGAYIDPFKKLFSKFKKDSDEDSSNL